jgi:hypothetical protein
LYQCRVYEPGWIEIGKWDELMVVSSSGKVGKWSTLATNSGNSYSLIYRVLHWCRFQTARGVEGSYSIDAEDGY